MTAPTVDIRPVTAAEMEAAGENRAAVELLLTFLEPFRSTVKAELDRNGIDPYPFDTRYELAAAIVAAMLERDLLAICGPGMDHSTREPARGDSLRTDLS